MKRLIKVTQEDIDNAGLNFSNCPIACALQRIVKEGICATVHPELIILWKKGRILEKDFDPIKLHPLGKLFVHNYDSKQPVMPIEFEQELPEEALRKELIEPRTGKGSLD